MYVYIIEIGQLSKAKNEFFFYDMEAFPSKKAAEHVINNMIDVNNGYNLSIDKSRDHDPKRRGEVEYTMYTYNCMSAPGTNEPSVPMRVRYVLRKMKVNRNF
jgi:hypothetical protein